MAKCSTCGAETELFDSGVPVCVRCDELRLPARERIADMLRERMMCARLRRDEADRCFREVAKSVGHEIPSPDGSYRVQQASRTYRDALTAVEKATRELNEFLLSGKIPADFDVRKDIGGQPGNCPKEKAG